MSTNNSIVNEANASVGFKSKSPEQQEYIKLRIHNRTLYDASGNLKDALALALNPKRSPEQDFELAQLIGSANTHVGNAVKHTYYQQVQIEKVHPEFKAEAKAQYEQAKQKSQNLGAKLEAVM